MGGKKQGGAHTPVEAPNTYNSAQVMRLVQAVCEGPIGGFANGDAHPLKSVYLNNTPIQNADGSYNFKGISSLFLDGTANQPYLPGFDKTEATYGIGAEVKKNLPITRTVTNPNIDELRVTVGVQQNFLVADNGDSHPAHTQLRITLLRGGSAVRQQMVDFTEKSSSVYYVDAVFNDLPERPFELRVERITSDPADSKTVNATSFSSYTEISNTKQSYPYTVMAGWKIDSDQFGGTLPTVSYHLKGKTVRVPAGYDPVARTYPDLWTGGWEEKWTNNPAWVLLDILTNQRYSGLGKRLSDNDIDTAMLYKIAKYCDELVDDDFGGKEPRVTCNAYITQELQAYDLINDLTAAFQGQPLWNGLQATFALDSDAPPVAVYTNANIVGGEFVYQGVARKAIHTAARVGYADKNDNYEESAVYLQNDELVRRYGLNIKNVTAFGCDSRGQATRMAAWILQTEMRQRETVTFTLGREGLKHLPGDIIEVADNDYARTSVGGRLLSRRGNEVEVDREVGNAVGGNLHMAVGGKHIKAKVLSQSGRRLTLDRVVEAKQDSVWALQKTVTPRLYRAVGIAENTDEGTYTITAVRHDSAKYSEVDSAAGKLPVTLHSTPKDSLEGLRAKAEDGKLLLSWDGSANSKFDHYVIRIEKDGQPYGGRRVSPTPQITLENLAPGEYRIFVRGVLEDGRMTDEIRRTLVIDYTITGLKATPRLQAIQLDWILPQTVVNDVQTEIWYAESNNRDAAKKLTTLPYPQNSYTLSGVAVSDRYWFWLRLVDAAGNSGEWAAAVAGRSDPNPAPIVAQLRGAIEKSSLSKALIDSLDADAASKVAAEAQARVAAIQAAAKKAADDLAAEAQARAAAVQAASKKAADDLTAKARELGTKITAVETVNAEQARQIQAVTAAQGSTAAGLEAEKRARAEGDRAEAQARETLTGRLNAAEGSITAERQARIKADEAQTAATEALKTRVGNAEGSITALRETVSRNDGARAAEIRQLQAKFTIPDTRNDNQPPSWYYANHSRSTVSEFKQADVLGLGGGFAALETVVPWGDPSGGRIFQTAYLQDGTVMRRKSDTAHTYAGGVYNYTKDLWTEWAADETANGAQAKADAVRRVAEAAQAAANRVDADLTRYQNVQVQKEKAQAEEVKTLKAELSGQKARVEQSASALATLDGKVRAMYGLKVETVSGGRKVIAGLALGADGQTGDSQMLVYADKFAIVDPKSKTLKSPFVVQTAGGKTQMALSGDFVADGLIHGRHIAAGQTLSSPSIEGGSLNIGGGRFSVSNTGQVSISAASGNVGMKMTNDRIEVYDENGVLRVKLGKLS